MMDYSMNNYSRKIQGGTKPFTPPSEKMPKDNGGTPQTCPEFTPPSEKMPTRMR